MNASKQTRVGFIGLGIMGLNMARHLLAAGYPLSVANRSRAAAEELLAKGAVWCDTPGAIAASSDVIITMVGVPADVEEVYLGDDGIVAHMAPGTLLIDMSTSSPSLARRIAERAAACGCEALDAPVSGGEAGARDAKLSIMVGGSQEGFERALPLLQKLGTNIQRQGEAGAGQHTKMCNQILIASTMMGICEGLAYAKQQGLDLDRVLEAIGGGAAASFQLTTFGKRIVQGDFAPGFYAEHLLKDLSIALEEADRIGQDLPGLRQAKKLYASLVEQGYGRLGTQALFKHYEK